MIRRMLTLGSLGTLIACSGGGNTVSAQQIESALDESFGGLTPMDEAPSFDDDAVRVVPKFDMTFVSEMPAPGSSMPLTSYRVALLWGHFPGASDETNSDTQATPATWSGSISVDAGSIDVTRTLSFDDGDSIDARSAPNSVSFTSHTVPFVDGVLVHVRVPGGGDTAPTLHFVTGELTTDVDLDAATNGQGSVFHGDGDQGLAVVGWNDTTSSCTSGIAYGRWVKMGASVGTLRAHLMGMDGSDLGDAHGIWGHAKVRDANVFFGKSIDASGAFTNFFEGTYDTGTIRGTLGKTATQGGTFVGVYSDGFDGPDGRGAFVSKWMGACSAL